jgi:hypothetical protein
VILDCNRSTDIKHESIFSFMSLYFNGNKQMQISYDLVTDHEPETI